MKLAFLGIPGAGKGVQADLVSKHLGIKTISTGDMYRHHIKKKTIIGKQIKELLAGGNFAPDWMTNKMMDETLLEMDDFIVDGYPRNMVQGEFLSDNYILDKVIFLKVDEDVALARLLERGKTSKRDDDSSEEIIRHRFDVYREVTAPLEDYYREKGLLVEICGNNEIGEVFADIKSIL